MPDKTPSKQRLWVVSELYYPEETSTGYYMTRIAEGLVESFDVCAVSGLPNYLYRDSAAPKRETHKGVRIHRLSATRFDKNRIFLKALNMLTLGLSVFLFSLRNFRKYDRVLVVTTPPTLPFFVAIASLLKGTGMTLLIHDTYPEILSAAGKLRPDSVAFSLLQSLKNWIYKIAEKIIVVGRDMEALARNQTGGLDTEIINIPNWAELETVRPDPEAGKRFRLAHGLERNFVVLYAGNMGYPNDLETIVGAAELLRDERTIRFVFLGSGAKLPWLKRRVAELALTNVVILDPRPREEQNEFLSGCDLGIVSLVPEMKGVSVPSRTYNLLASGKPIIGIVDSESEVGRIILEFQIGAVIANGDPKGFSEAVRRFAESPEELDQMGKRAREIALTEYDQETALNAYRRFMR
jgi:colanic acid biosynthesis glycosyl transferase WcaI